MVVIYIFHFSLFYSHVYYISWYDYEDYTAILQHHTRHFDYIFFTPCIQAIVLVIIDVTFLQCEHWTTTTTTTTPKLNFWLLSKDGFMNCANICFVLRFNILRYEFIKYVYFWAFSTHQNKIKNKSNACTCTQYAHTYIGEQADRLRL